MLNKIDKNLLSNVSIFSVNKVKKAIIYVKNYDFAHNYIKNQLKIDIIGEYHFINALMVKVTQNDIFMLSNISDVEYIASVSTANILINKSKKIIEVNKLYSQGLSGMGIGVAVIDTGCYPHLDFLLGSNRNIKFVDFLNNKTQLYDDNGHGTFVAGVIGGNGFVSNGNFSGIAPNCDLIILKAIHADGQTQTNKILDAMQWIYENKNKFNIQVVCMSFGSEPLQKLDPLCIGANVLWDAGIVVVCAGGNDGPKEGSVKSPGSSPKVITIGCADTRVESEINIPSFSSRGPIFDCFKPDLVAPGVEITSLANNIYFYTKMTGTSVSAPFVAGVSALILEKQKLTPNEIKSILLTHTVKLPFEANVCGSGLLNVGNI